MTPVVVLERISPCLIAQEPITSIIQDDIKIEPDFTYELDVADEDIYPPNEFDMNSDLIAEDVLNSATENVELKDSHGASHFSSSKSLNLSPSSPSTPKTLNQNDPPDFPDSNSDLNHEIAAKDTRVQILILPKLFYCK